MMETQLAARRTRARPRFGRSVLIAATGLLALASGCVRGLWPDGDAVDARAADAARDQGPPAEIAQDRRSADTGVKDAIVRDVGARDRGHDARADGPRCGNKVVEPGETCDGNCPASCNDGNPCTTNVMTGSSAACNVACSYPAITTCTNGDGCCPAGCNATSDNDCSASCGNGAVEAGETCDPPASCPTSCNDSNPCTTNVMTGSSAACNVACSYPAITTCTNGDGCCPSGCSAVNDNNCVPVCGNGVVESGETCDPPASCPTSCNDGNPCTVDAMTGSGATCSVSCSHVAITACVSGDACCPSGCSAATDADCAT